ncbi:TRAP transporter small permease subunit [Hydrogenophaga sp. BPS33]|uniref:TRAP transporter small permease subunit n=1 Tax=Hydrogenophaga sp. BPS33 TaxID=2651974 RepID=UPI0013204DCD|nr:TRAP transporter small permease [Hydrogenophaga sp. BPS33]QHE83598.1 TRAP transporter small permease [Hydrogenophaga sp. BPS33]
MSELPVRQADAPPAEGAGASDSYGAALPFGLHRLFGVMNALGTLWILALMVLINLDVFGRNLLSAPVRGVTELVSLSIVGIVFLQLSDTLRTGRFTRADILLDRLKRTRPALNDALHALFHAVGLALMVVILLASWEPLVESIRIREYVGAIGDFQAPVWPVRLITLVGLTATALCFGLLAWMDLRRLARRRQPGATA